MVIAFLTVYLTTKLGFTMGQAGLAMTFFGAGSLVGSYLGGRLVDVAGYYKVIFWSLLLGGIMFLFLQFMLTPWQVYAMIFALSVVAESFRPATMTAIAAYSKPENRTRSFSLIRMALNLGWSIGPALGGWLAVSVGYYTLFIFDGITCIAAAMLFLFFLKNEKPKESTTDVQIQGLASTAFKDRTYLLFLLLTTIGAIIFMQLLSTLPVFYKQELGMSESQIGALFALNGIIIVLIEMPSVFYLEKKFNQVNCIAIGVLLYGLTYLIFNVAGYSILVAVVSMLALTFGEIFNMPFTNAVALSRASPKNRGQYMGLFSMSFSMAHIIAPSLGMLVAAQFGFSVLWWVLFAMSLVAFGGQLLLKKHLV